MPNHVGNVIATCVLILTYELFSAMEYFPHMLLLLEVYARPFSPYSCPAGQEYSGDWARAITCMPLQQVVIAIIYDQGA